MVPQNLRSRADTGLGVGSVEFGLGSDSDSMRLVICFLRDVFSVQRGQNLHSNERAFCWGCMVHPLVRE